MNKLAIGKSIFISAIQIQFLSTNDFQIFILLGGL